MNQLSNKELLDILHTALKEDYPDESVLLGDSWELIAKIFYAAGSCKCTSTDLFPNVILSDN